MPAAPKKKCKTPKCRGNVKAGYTYCLGCEKGIRALMAADGYLTDLTFIKLEEKRRERDFIGDDGKIQRDYKSRTRAVSPPGIAVPGALMKSGKYKKKKEAA